MRASGNGEVDVCANNLLLMVRGEVPYDRTRGLDPRAVDMTGRDGADQVIRDAKWTLGVYEPRAVPREITVETEDAANGAFHVTAQLGR